MTLSSLIESLRAAALHPTTPTNVTEVRIHAGRVMLSVDSDEAAEAAEWKRRYEARDKDYGRVCGENNLLREKLTGKQ